MIGLTENFDPSLESHERKIGPNDGNKTVEQKSDEPAVILNNLGKTNLPFIEDVKPRCNQVRSKSKHPADFPLPRERAAYGALRTYRAIRKPLLSK